MPSFKCHFIYKRFLRAISIDCGIFDYHLSFTLLFTLLALLLFGGPTLQSFLLVLIIGVVAGTYSSIAIASQVLVAWEYGDLSRLFGRQTVQSTSTG